jgi:hypothetical protein
MHVQHLSWNASDGWSPANLGGDRDLVLYFGTRSVLEDGERFQELQRRFPGARLGS